MQTPYQILQLKQKQKKKIISELKKQRSFSIRYSKSGQNATQYCMQKGRHNIKNQERKYTIDIGVQNRHCESQKKYEIVFRESIRKVNAYRTKVYHTHSALKNQKFVNQFLTTNRQNKSHRQDILSQTQNQKSPQTSPKNRIKPHFLEQKYETLNLGKYKIFFSKNGDRCNSNQIIPEIQVQKCKLNLNDNEYKLKIQQTIESLYHHGTKQEKSLRKQSLDSYFTDKDNVSEENYRKEMNIIERRHHTRDAIRSPRSMTEIKNQIKLLCSNEQFDEQYKTISNVMDCSKVANFIKSKKKKRLPISVIKNKYQSQSPEFRRTITDNFVSSSQRKNIIQNIQQRYFSPNKGTRIKFNSIEESISGWQPQPCEQNILHEAHIKSPLLEH